MRLKRYLSVKYEKTVFNSPDAATVINSRLKLMILYRFMLSLLIFQFIRNSLQLVLEMKWKA